MARSPSGSMYRWDWPARSSSENRVVQPMIKCHPPSVSISEVQWMVDMGGGSGRDQVFMCYYIRAVSGLYGAGGFVKRLRISNFRAGR